MIRLVIIILFLPFTLLSQEKSMDSLEIMEYFQNDNLDIGSDKFFELDSSKLELGNESIWKVLFVKVCKNQILEMVKYIKFHKDSISFVFTDSVLNNSFHVFYDFIYDNNDRLISIEIECKNKKYEYLYVIRYFDKEYLIIEEYKSGCIKSYKKFTGELLLKKI